MTASRRSLPPLNGLRAFEVAGRRLNFRAAAEDLGVTQSAVAQQVRQLEEQLGFALFERLARGLSLTPRGARYLADVTRAFDLLDAATSDILARPEAVTLSATPTFATKLLIPKLGALAQALPGIGLRTLASETLCDFDRDQVDIAVRMARGPFPSGLEARLLFRQELVAVASPALIGAHPFDPDRLISMPLLHDAHDHWPQFLEHAGKLTGPSFNQTALAIDAALAGQGIALVCRAFVAADLAAGRLQQVTPKTLILSPDFYLVRKRTAHRPPAAQAVWDWCLEHLSAAGG